MTHFKDCPVTSGYVNWACTCDMAGEEGAVVDMQIARQEGKEKWWHLSTKLTLRFFGCGFIPHTKEPLPGRFPTEPQTSAVV